MTFKKYRIIEVSIIIILSPLMGLAAVYGYGWIAVPVFVTYAVIMSQIRFRFIKERTFDERENTIAEKSIAIAGLIFMFLALVSGTTLTFFGRDTPVLIPIGLTLIGSAVAISLFMLIARFYFSQKMGG